MPRYFYTAKSLEGKEKSGVLEAKDEHQLAKILRQEGFLLIFAKEKDGKKERFKFFLPFLGISLSEKIFFIRNLQVMIAAGLSLSRAISLLSQQTKGKNFQKILFNISQSIEKGKNFSEALANYPKIFPELFQNMIKVGEESGTLEKVLKILSFQMEKEYEIRSKIKGAMIYPAVIILVMILVGIAMLIFVIPQLAKTFKELEIELPLTTRIVIGFSNFLVKKWFLSLLAIFILIFLFSLFSKTSIGKKLIDSFLLKVPIFSSIIKNTNYASTARTLSSLVASGIALPRSLEVTARTLGNFYYQKSLLVGAERVRKGERLSEVLGSFKKIYSPTFLQMLAVGEETGETSNILAKLADFYEEEVFNATKNLASVIEPLLILIIGGAVGFFAVSMIQPLYSMLGAIK